MGYLKRLKVEKNEKTIIGNNDMRNTNLKTYEFVG